MGCSLVHGLHVDNGVPPRTGAAPRVRRDTRRPVWPPGDETCSRRWQWKGSWAWWPVRRGALALGGVESGGGGVSATVQADGLHGSACDDAIPARGASSGGPSCRFADSSNDAGGAGRHPVGSTGSVCDRSHHVRRGIWARRSAASRLREAGRLPPWARSSLSCRFGIVI